MGGAASRSGGRLSKSERLADLLSRIGNRIGFENVIRYLPAESHIPEHPLTLFPPERLEAGAGAGAASTAGVRIPKAGEPPIRPPRLRWRCRWLTLAAAGGPERRAPEWWWDDPAWRSGLRDYWRIETAEGPRLWLFHTPQAAQPGWWAHGAFA
jgi:protein ImuB